MTRKVLGRAICGRCLAICLRVAFSSSWAVTTATILAPLIAVGDLDHTAFDILRQGFLQDILDLDQRDHLAADLDEALQTADMPEKTVRIDIAHIAGIVPAAADMQGGLLEVIEIALHDVVALDEDPAVLAGTAGFAGLVVLDADLDAGDGFADAAGRLNSRVLAEMTGEHSVAP